MVCATPDGSWVNWAIARVMYFGEKNRLVANVVPGQDTNKILDMWTAIGKPMPFALFQGGAPIIPFVSGMCIPERVNERDVIGGYLNKPLELVACETVNLEVQANAEIVIDGTFSIDELVEEGPMGEFSGSICLAGKNNNQVLNISAVSYRNNVILPVVVVGYPIEENHTVWALGIAAKIYSDLKEAKVPVTSCFIPFESAVHWLVVTIDSQYIWA
ncbi:MAG: UbiD family decarboxylase domain-containing protein [Legionella sp.]